VRQSDYSNSILSSLTTSVVRELRTMRLVDSPAWMAKPSMAPALQVDPKSSMVRRCGYETPQAHVPHLSPLSYDELGVQTGISVTRDLES
jgi:hypothetical protein